MTAPVEETERRMGRPRSAEADRAIIDAALELFADHGLDGLTVEGVAARAGVGKATVYRRYPSKIDLVVAAASGLSRETAPTPDTGALRSDLLAWLHGLTHLLRGTIAGRCVPVLVAETSRNVELATAHQAFIAARRVESKAVVRRGIERGELAAAADPEIVVDMLAGPVFYRAFVSRDPLSERVLTELVDAVLRAFAPVSPPPAP